MLDLLAIGEVMAEIRNGSGDVNSPDFSVGFAGDTYNTAVYCKRELGDDGKVGFMTRVGQDNLSLTLIKEVARHGLETAYIARDEQAQIGIYSVSTSPDGERSFDYWRDRSAARQMFSTMATTPELPKARIYYVSGITMAILTPHARTQLVQALKTQKDKGALIAFDSNYRPKLWESKALAQQTISNMWGLSDIALPSIDDEMDLFDESSEQSVIDRFTALNPTTCAIKRGHKGPFAPSIGLQQAHNFEPVKKVVDTTAAGDSFNGAYLASFLQSESEMTCLMRAHSVASHVVQFSGAIVQEGRFTEKCDYLKTHNVVL